MTRRVQVVAVLTMLVGGCGGPGYKIANVSGRITVDGKPLYSATIQFYPVAESGAAAGPTSVGHTDEDGRYTLALVDSPTTKGAAVGKNKVFINFTPKDDPNDKRPKHYVQLPARYNRRSELEFDVPAAGTSAADFPLTSR